MAKSESKLGLPPLDWLRVFEAAGRCGGFTAASKEFGLTQAAVSQRIRNLETWLGRNLFIRNPRGVTLTVDGESYLPLVREAIDALARSTEDLFAEAPRELRIAALSSHLDTLVIGLAMPFLEANPQLRLVTHSVPRRTEFNAEKTPLQLRFGRGSWPGREAALLHREILAPMVAPQFTNCRIVDLAAIKVRGERPGWREWARESGQPMPGPAKLSCDSMEHGLSAARLGLGVVLGSLAQGMEDLAQKRLVRLNLPELVTADGYWLTWPTGHLRSSRHEKLVSALRDALATRDRARAPLRQHH